MDKLEKIQPPPADFYFRRQEKMSGTGDALLLVESWTNGEPFVVAYPDDIVVGEVGLTTQLIQVFGRNGGRTVLAGQECPGDVSRYGVVGYEPRDGVDVVTTMVEKPAPGTEPSRVVSYGRYLYAADIFPALHAAREEFHGPGELTQTHAFQRMLGGELTLCQFTGTVLDVGSPMGYLAASVEMGLRRPEYAAQTRALLLQLARREGLV